MPLTCGNALLGLIGQPLNHSSTTNLHRRSATAGRYRTDRTGATEDLTARGKTATQRMLNRPGSSTLVAWLPDHGRRDWVL